MSDASIKSLDDLQKFVDVVLSNLGHKHLLLLSGGMGAGKTEFVRAIGRTLGIDNVSSPTYAIHQRYSSRRGFVDHVDLYRLTDAQDLESSGFWDLFLADSGLIVVEWADRLDLSVWPTDWPRTSIEIKLESDGSRSITFL